MNTPDELEDEVVVEATSTDEDFTEVEENDIEEFGPSTKFYRSFRSAFDTATLNDEFSKTFYNAIKKGKRNVFNKTIREERIFETDYLDKLEECYPYFVNIINNPKKSIRYDEEVVLVEKAHKINADTVRHLAAHTELIKKIDTNGDVIPSKVLTTFAEEEINIYENRFIKTLIYRIDTFLTKRYDVIKENLESFQNDRVKVNDVFKLADVNVDMTIDISVKKEISESMKKAQEIFNRIVKLREVYSGLKNSPFMNALKKARMVLPPIMKTNIILHNADFKMAYSLWLYMDRYDTLGFSVNVKERNRSFSSQLGTDVDDIFAIYFATIMQSRRLGAIIFKDQTFKEFLRKKPKELKNVENELSLKPGNYEFEKNAINEFYLQETMKYFKASLKTLNNEGSGETQSLRIVYKQMLEIIDNIYPTVFDARETYLEDTDGEVSLEAQLEMAKRRKKVLKIVREQKELNLAKMERLEEKANKNIIAIENKIALAQAKEESRLQRERERQARILMAEKKKEEIRKAREEARKEKEKALEREKQEKIKERERQKEKQRLKLERERERKKKQAAERREKMKTSKRRNIKARRKSVTL